MDMDSMLARRKLRYLHAHLHASCRRRKLRCPDLRSLPVHQISMSALRSCCVRHHSRAYQRTTRNHSNYSHTTTSIEFFNKTRQRGPSYTSFTKQPCAPSIAKLHRTMVGIEHARSTNSPQTPAASRHNPSPQT